MRWQRWLALLAALLGVYLAATYVAVPFLWKGYVRRHPALEDIPAVTHTKDGIPGDPLNVALVGTEDELKNAMTAVGWYGADALGFRSDMRIAADTVLERPYDEAPVSNLYLFGRKEDVAFEQPAGDDPPAAIMCVSGVRIAMIRAAVRCGWVPSLTISESGSATPPGRSLTTSRRTWTLNETG